MDTILKVEHQGDLRRALLKGTPQNLAAIEHAVQEIWPGQSVQHAKYEDEEGDLCTLADATFSDFLGTMKKGKNQVLRLQLVAASDDHKSSSSSAANSMEAFSSPWQRVEQGTEEDSECLHTLADLTDVQQAAEAVAQCAAAEESVQKTGEVYEKPDDAQLSAYVAHLPEAEVEVCARSESGDTEEYEIATSENVPAMSDYTESECGADQSHYDHVAEEKIDIIIAAFDEAGDAHLNFKEIQALHKAAQGGQICLTMFKQMCADWCEDPEVGFGRDTLKSIYGNSGPREQALEEHFEAAKQKLQSPRVLLMPRYRSDPPKLFGFGGIITGEIAAVSKKLNYLSGKVGSRIKTHAQRQYDHQRFCLGSRQKTVF